MSSVTAAAIGAAAATARAMGAPSHALEARAAEMFHQSVELETGGWPLGQFGYGFMSAGWSKGFKGGPVVGKLCQTLGT